MAKFFKLFLWSGISLAGLLFLCRSDVVSAAGLYQSVGFNSFSGSAGAPYFCSPYLVPSNGQVWGWPTTRINYIGSYSQKADAISATIQSLEDCLRVRGYQLTQSYIYFAYGFVFPSYSPYKMWGYQGFKTMSYSFSCTFDCFGLPAGICALFGSSCTSTYNGEARQADYSATSPESVHLRHFACYNSRCGQYDNSVPTYQGSEFTAPSDPRNAVIRAVNHGFGINWAAPASTGGTSVSYKVYRSNSASNFTDAVTMSVGSVLSFTDNKFKDIPTETLYYKITAINTAGLESPGVIVNTSGLNFQNIISSITITGAGFLPPPSKNEVSLINPSDVAHPINCTGFLYKDSHTLINGVCDISTATTGVFDVKVVIKDASGTIVAQGMLPSGFHITYQKPDENIVIAPSNIDLTSGTLTINSIKGGNLYTGYKVFVVADGIKHECFALSNYDWDKQEFGGGSCLIDPAWFVVTGGDMSKFAIVVSGDEKSDALAVSGLNFSCSSNAWSPDASTVCQEQSLVQISNCGSARNVLGTLEPVWTPVINELTCGSLVQSANNCNPVRTRPVNGSKVCGITESCIDNLCVCQPKTAYQACIVEVGWECGSRPDGCGGTINCGSCVAGQSYCSSGKCIICNCDCDERDYRGRCTSWKTCDSNGVCQ